MKQYFTIFAALLSYGCVTQQPKEAPPQDNRVEAESVKSSTIKVDSDEVDYGKVDSKPLSTSSQTPVKVSKVIAPKTSISKTSSKATPKKKVKKEPVIKKQVVESSKAALTTEKPVKSNSSQLGSSKQIEPENTPIIRPESTPLNINNLEPENSVIVNSEAVSTDNLTESEIISPEISLESNIETEKQANEDIVIEPNNLDFDLEKLPLSFGGTWFLDRNKDKVSNTTRCLLSSQKQNFNDGYSDSKISLQLTSNSLLIKTKSSIDLTYPDVGMSIDQNEHFPLEYLFGETSIIIKKNIQQITSQLLNGKKLTVNLGFWPTWPKKETSHIDFLLSDFNKAYQSFLACEKL